MTVTLRPYQSALLDGVRGAWAPGARSVMAVLPTGGGKTVCFSSMMAAEPGASVAIAHRQELVSQISLALARFEVMHRIIGPRAVIQDCVRLHMIEVGRSWYDPRARAAVAGVDTLIRMDGSDPWFRAVTLLVMDEGHHVLRANKWGRAVEMFPAARGLLVTATPMRSDGKGLGRHADGIADALVVGPGMRDLIAAGHLSRYRVFAPPSDLDLSAVPLSAGGDYSPPKLSAAVHASRIVGDVVEHYLRAAPGKPGVTFAVDVAAAREIERAFVAAGVPAAMVTADTPTLARATILREFRARRLLQLVNVDLFGEGFDLPAIETVSMARPTASYPLYVQQFGRALRRMEGKQHAIILDHVGNVARHGLPDRPREWSLYRRERRSAGASTIIPIRVCPQCAGAFERIHRSCPYCGHQPEPAGRSSPEQVDGDLAELTEEALAAMRGEVLRMDGPPRVPAGAAPEVSGAIHKRHRERQAAQQELRRVMALWGGARVAEGMAIHEAQRLFFHRHGVDVLTAQALGRPEAEELTRALKGQL